MFWEADEVGTALVEGRMERRGGEGVGESVVLMEVMDIPRGWRVRSTRRKTKFAS